MGHELAKVRGVPTRIMRSEKEVAEIRKQREAQQAQQQAIMEAQEAGAAMESIGKGAAMMEDADVKQTG